MYLGLVQYCQEKFASDVDLCKGYALKMVLGAREIAYYSDLNPNVYPANDEEFLTADFKGFYNELSSKTQKKIEGPDDIGVTIYGRLLTADEVRAEKKQHVEKILQQFYQTSAPTGVSDPELEPLVIAYFQKLNPDLKIKTVVFNERWNVHKVKKDVQQVDTSGNVVTIQVEEIVDKRRVAAVSVEVPNDPGQYVLSLVVDIRMDYEGGGNYGEPYCKRLDPKTPNGHKFDLLTSDGYSDNNEIKKGDVTVFFESYITYDNRWRLYEYHNTDVFLPIRP